MDDNWREVLTTAIQVGGGAVLGFIAAWRGFIWSRDLERERWHRDDARRADDLERAKAERWLTTKRETAARYVGRAQEAVGLAATDPAAGLTAIGAVSSAEAELLIVWPQLEAAARAHTETGFAYVRAIVDLRRDDEAKPGPEVIEARDRFSATQQAFVKQARESLLD
jgi:hypothetical protein